MLPYLVACGVEPAEVAKWRAADAAGPAHPARGGGEVRIADRGTYLEVSVDGG